MVSAERIKVPPVWMYQSKWFGWVDEVKEGRECGVVEEDEEVVVEVEEAEEEVVRLRRREYRAGTAVVVRVGTRVDRIA